MTPVHQMRKPVVVRCCLRSGQMKHVDIFTDGACSGNPGPGVMVLYFALTALRRSFRAARGRLPITAWR